MVFALGWGRVCSWLGAGAVKAVCEVVAGLEGKEAFGSLGGGALSSPFVLVLSRGRVLKDVFFPKHFLVLP